MNTGKTPGGFHLKPSKSQGGMLAMGGGEVRPRDFCCCVVVVVLFCFLDRPKMLDLQTDENEGDN